jgi:hypothetical protein
MQVFGPRRTMTPIARHLTVPGSSAPPAVKPRTLDPASASIPAPDPANEIINFWQFLPEAAMNVPHRLVLVDPNALPATRIVRTDRNNDSDGVVHSNSINK